MLRHMEQFNKHFAYFVSMYIIFIFSKNCIVHQYMSADLTKGSFRHFSSFYVILISETSKISIFCMFLQESQIASNM